MREVHRLEFGDDLWLMVRYKATFLVLGLLPHQVLTDNVRSAFRLSTFLWKGFSQNSHQHMP
jgi:hypothetical protein